MLCTQSVPTPIGRPSKEGDHLEKTIAAMHVYRSAIIAETAEDIPASALDRRYLDGLFQQFSADVPGSDPLDGHHA
jgi:hypothetical protein